MGRKQKQEVANRRLDLGKEFFKQYGRRIECFSITVIYPSNRQKKKKDLPNFRLKSSDPKKLCGLHSLDYGPVYF